LTWCAQAVAEVRVANPMSYDTLSVARSTLSWVISALYSALDRESTPAGTAES
jgi:hypothetical protein